MPTASLKRPIVGLLLACVVLLCAQLLRTGRVAEAPDIGAVAAAAAPPPALPPGGGAAAGARAPPARGRDRGRGGRAAPDAAGGARSSCAHQALIHGRSVRQLKQDFGQAGRLRWVLVDAFVSESGNPCGYDKPCPGSLPAVTFVVTGHVYVAPPYNMTLGQAKTRRRGDYGELMKKPGLRWVCSLPGVGAGAGRPSQVDALPVVYDGDKHNIAVHCPLPRAYLESAAVDASGRLQAAVNLTAESAEGAELTFRGARPCRPSLVPAGVELGACTMFGEMKPIAAADSAVAWATFMLRSGFDFVALYLDPTGDADGFAAALRLRLAAEIARGAVALVLFHMVGRAPFETQTAQQTHCHWRFRGRAKWLAQLDIDEYLQPLGGHATLRGITRKYDANGRAAALQVRNRYWDHHPTQELHVNKTRFDVWNMVWRDARPSMGGREKLLYKTDRVDYISVHKVLREPRK